MPDQAQSFFNPATTQLGPEPPGFDILREMLIRQIINQKQNPYGFTEQGANNISGPLFSTGAHNAPGLDYMGMGTGQPPSGGGGGGQPPVGRGTPQTLGPRPIGPRVVSRGAGQQRQQQPQSGWFWELLRQLGPAGQGKMPVRQTPQLAGGRSYDAVPGFGTGGVQTPPIWGGQQPPMGSSQMGGFGGIPQVSTPLPVPPMQAPMMPPSMGSWGADNVWHPGNVDAYRAFQLQRMAGTPNARGIQDLPGWAAVNYSSAGHSLPAAMVGPQGQIQAPQGTSGGYIRNSMTPTYGAPRMPQQPQQPIADPQPRTLPLPPTRGPGPMRQPQVR